MNGCACLVLRVEIKTLTPFLPSNIPCTSSLLPSQLLYSSPSPSQILPFRPSLLLPTSLSISNLDSLPPSFSLQRNSILPFPFVSSCPMISSFLPFSSFSPSPSWLSFQIQNLYFIFIFIYCLIYLLNLF